MGTLKLIIIATIIVIIVEVFIFSHEFIMQGNGNNFSTIHKNKTNKAGNNLTIKRNEVHAN